MHDYTDVIDNKVKKEQRILSIASFCSVFALMFQMLLYGLLGSRSSIHILVLIIAAIPTIRALPIWLKYSFDRAILLYGIILLVFVSQYFIFPANRIFMTEYLFQFLFMCIPAYISMSIDMDERIRIDVFQKICWSIFGIGEIYFIAILTRIIGWGNHSYNMSFSYYMLLPALGFTFFFFNGYGTINVFPMLLAVLSIVMLGSRGPLLCWGLFFLFGMYFSKVRIFFKIMWTLVLGGVLAFYEQIMYGIILHNQMRQHKQEICMIIQNHL